MRLRSLILLLVPVLLYLSACTPEHSKIVVAKFDDQNIDMREFEDAFSRNTLGDEKSSADSLESMKKFLDLYVNYKMKLRDAFVRGYYTDPEMQQELKTYKINVGKTLYLDKVLYEPNLRKLYDRRKYELRVSHIFLTPDSTMDADAVVKLGNELIQRIKNGENFAELAKKYSKDNYTKDIGGDVYYVTAGAIYMPSLEDAAYDTPVGEIYPSLVKSNYGYHIIKVTEKNLRKPGVRVAHIFAPYQDSTGQVDSMRALKKITEAFNTLKAGAQFGDVAKKYSEDKNSAPKGGDLGFVERGQMPKEIDEAAFKLNPGEVSDIVASPYGYHILTVTEVKPMPSYADDRDNLKKMYERIRFKDDYSALIDSLKKAEGYSENKNALDLLASKSDSLKINDSFWKSSLKKELGDSTAFKYAGTPVTVDSLVANLIKKGGAPKTISRQFLSDAAESYGGELLVDRQALNFDKTDKAFAALMKEYESGIYLFRILDDEVWSRIKVDSTGLEKFYDANKENYKMPARVEYQQIWTANESKAKEAFAALKSRIDFDSVFVKFNQKKDNQNSSGGHWLVEAELNDISRKAVSLANEGDVSEPFKADGGWAVVKLLHKIPARLKTFEEAKAEAASQYQEKESKRLEDEYLGRLKNLYHPVYYYDELQKAFKK